MPRPSRYAPDNLPRPRHWTADAACADAEPDLFHPEGHPGVVLILTAEAKTYCARCQVSARCLAESLARADPWGVWGGLDEDERAALLRRRRERERADRKRDKEAADGAARQQAPAPAA